MPTFDYDAENIEPQEFEPMPEGDYNLRIVKVEMRKTSTAGDPMAVVNYEVYDGKFKGRPVNFHNVVFFRDKNNKGAGMAINFLKCLEEPHEGKFTVNTDNWLGKIVRARVVQSEPNDKGYTFPNVKWVNKAVIDYTMLYGNGQQEPAAAAAGKAKPGADDPDVPF